MSESSVSDWSTDPRVCGSCIAWRAPDEAEVGEDGAPVGTCRLRPELRRVPATLGRCALYRGRGQPAAPVTRPARGKRTRSTRASGPAVPAPAPAPAEAERWSGEQTALHRAGRDALGGHGLRPMMPRFQGGTTEIVDAEGRVIVHPNERLFAHLCRLRRALDELEARLEDGELQEPVRRARGSLTTFNFLFAAAEDHFSGKAT